MDILTAIATDYQQFPQHQSYHLYAPDVYFKDPLTEFRGIARYQKMIHFMGTWFKNIDLQLHQIDQKGDTIHTRWTLTWTTPLPWQPRITITGRSELRLNADHLIISHIDYWDCSPWNVARQHFASKPE
ncbi:MAG: DUF2358 domain-containing protein [Synechocystis sp.]|jgi:hypothetical protein